MKKRILSVLLALCMLLSILPTTVLAAETAPDAASSDAASSEAAAPEEQTPDIDSAAAVQAQIDALPTAEEFTGMDVGTPIEDGTATADISALSDAADVAEVTVGGSTIGYTSFANALNAANGNTATVKVLDSIADAATNVTLTSGTIMLDLNGKTVGNAKININGANLTFKNGSLNSGSQITLNSGSFNMESTATAIHDENDPTNPVLIINGGTATLAGSLPSMLEVKGGSLFITGGQYDGQMMVSTDKPSITLTGGSFSFIMTPNPDTVPASSFLGDGYGYKTIGGDWLTDDDADTNFLADVYVASTAPVVITKQPTDSATGMPLTITAEPKNSGDTITYQWYKEAGAADTKVGDNSPTYTPTEIGEYYCIVTCNNFTATSDAVTVGVPMATVTIGSNTYNYTSFSKALAAANSDAGSETATVKPLESCTDTVEEGVSLVRSTAPIVVDLCGFTVEINATSAGYAYPITIYGADVTMRNGTLSISRLISVKGGQLSLENDLTVYTSNFGVAVGNYFNLDIDSGTVIVNGATIGKKETSETIGALACFGGNVIVNSGIMNGKLFINPSYYFGTSETYSAPILNGGSFSKIDILNMPEFDDITVADLLGTDCAYKNASGYVSDTSVVWLNDVEVVAAPEASVTHYGSGTQTTTTPYATFTEAAAAAENGDTITLLRNTTSAKWTISDSKSLTLDLKGKTLTQSDNNSNFILITSGSALTVKDSTEAQDGKIIGAASSYTILVNGGFTLESGSIENNHEYSLAAINSNAGAVITMKGGYVKSAVNSGILVSAGTSITITGGTVEGADYALKISEKGPTITLSGGTFKTGVDSIYIAPLVRKKAGDLLADGYCYYVGETAGGTVADATKTSISGNVTVGVTDSHPDNNGDGYCDTYGEILDGISAVAGYALNIQGTIGVKYYIELGETALAEDANPEMHFTVNGKTTVQTLADATKTTSGSKTLYVFTCRVGAQQMTDKISGQIFVGEQAGKTFTQSVRGYADVIFKDADANADYANVKPLITAMLQYGGNAQTYVSYNTDALANAGLTDGDISGVTADTLLQYKQTAPAAAGFGKFYGTSLTLNSETTLRYYFEPAEDATLDDVTFTNDGTAMTPKTVAGRTCISIENITAKNLDQVYTITATKDGETITVPYSALAYAYVVLNSQQSEYITADLQNVMRALYLYNVQADAYNPQNA